MVYQIPKTLYLYENMQGIFFEIQHLKTLGVTFCESNLISFITTLPNHKNQIINRL